jgi:hypothetical protein
MGVADHGEGPVFQPLLGLGKPLDIALKCAVDGLEGAGAL